MKVNSKDVVITCGYKTENLKKNKKKNSLMFFKEQSKEKPQKGKDLNFIFLVETSF